MQDDIRLYEAEGFKALEETHPQTSGLSVCGFVFAEPFDILLRKLTPEYLQAAWKNLRTTLTHHNLLPGDLSYGWLHPGVAAISRFSRISSTRFTDDPSSFTGWVSLELSELWRDSGRYNALDEDLAQQIPPLRCGDCYRGLKWKIRPDNYSVALRLMEVLWIDEPSDWVPKYILESKANQDALWTKIAAAIEQRDQTLLDSLMVDARDRYSPVGYKILLRGFASYIMGTGPYLPADMGDHLSLEFRSPLGHSNIYPDVEAN